MFLSSIGLPGLGQANEVLASTGPNSAPSWVPISGVNIQWPLTYEYGMQFFSATGASGTSWPGWTVDVGPIGAGFPGWQITSYTSGAGVFIGNATIGFGTPNAGNTDLVIAPTGAICLLPVGGLYLMGYPGFGGGTFVEITENPTTVTISAKGSGAAASLNLVTKGAGTVQVNGTPIGGVTFPLTNAGDEGFQPGGVANNALNLHNGAGAGNGLNIAATAAGNGLGITVISSGGNEPLTFDAKGSGLITIGGVSTGGVTLASGGGHATVPTPTLATDAATKGYVDGVAQGLSIKPSCLVATAAALPANTSVGGVITITATGTLTVDGVLTALGDRILVQDEATTANNGIYTVTTAGAGGVKAVLTRAVEMSTSGDVPGAFSFIESGSTNAGAGFVVTTPTQDSAFVINVNPILWTQFSGAGELVAGTGITITADTISVTAVSPSASPAGWNVAVTAGTVATHNHGSTLDPLAFGMVFSFANASSGSNAAWPTSNTSIYIRAYGSQSVTNFNFQVASTSGNMDIGEYASTGSGATAAPTGNPIAHKGSTAAPSNGFVTVSVGTTETIVQGAHWLALAFDNTTITIGRVSDTQVGFASGTCNSQATNFPLGAVGTLAASLYVPAVLTS